MTINVKLSGFEGNERKTAREIMKNYSFFLKVTLCIALLSPVPCLFATMTQDKQNGALANIFTALFWLLHVVTEVLLATSVCWTGTRIIKLLEAHESLRPEDKDKEKAVKGLKFMVNQVFQSAVMNGGLGLVVSFWPWMRNKSTYMLCFGTLAVPMLFASMLLILTPPRKQKKQKTASQVQKPNLITTTTNSPPSDVQRPLNPEIEPTQEQAALVEQATLVEHQTNMLDDDPAPLERVDIVENPETGEIELISYSGHSNIHDVPSVLIRNDSVQDSP